LASKLTLDLLLKNFKESKQDISGLSEELKGFLSIMQNLGDELKGLRSLNIDLSSIEKFQQLATQSQGKKSSFVSTLVRDLGFAGKNLDVLDQLVDELKQLKDIGSTNPFANLRADASELATELETTEKTVLESVSALEKIVGLSKATGASESFITSILTDSQNLFTVLKGIELASKGLAPEEIFKKLKEEEQKFIKSAEVATQQKTRAQKAAAKQVVAAAQEEKKSAEAVDEAWLLTAENRKLALTKFAQPGGSVVLESATKLKATQKEINSLTDAQFEKNKRLGTILEKLVNSRREGAKLFEAGTTDDLIAAQGAIEDLNEGLEEARRRWRLIVETKEKSAADEKQLKLLTEQIQRAKTLKTLLEASIAPQQGKAEGPTLPSVDPELVKLRQELNQKQTTTASVEDQARAAALAKTRISEIANVLKDRVGKSISEVATKFANAFTSQDPQHRLKIFESSLLDLLSVIRDVDRVSEEINIPKEMLADARQLITTTQKEIGLHKQKTKELITQNKFLSTQERLSAEIIEPKLSQPTGRQLSEEQVGKTQSDLESSLTKINKADFRFIRANESLKLLKNAIVEIDELIKVSDSKMGSSLEARKADIEKQIGQLNSFLSGKSGDPFSRVKDKAPTLPQGEIETQEVTFGKPDTRGFVDASKTIEQEVAKVDDKVKGLKQSLKSVDEELDTPSITGDFETIDEKLNQLDKNKKARRRTSKEGLTEEAKLLQEKAELEKKASDVSLEKAKVVQEAKSIEQKKIAVKQIAEQKAATEAAAAANETLAQSVKKVEAAEKKRVKITGVSKKTTGAGTRPVVDTGTEDVAGQVKRSAEEASRSLSDTAFSFEQMLRLTSLFKVTSAETSKEMTEATGSIGRSIQASKAFAEIPRKIVEKIIGTVNDQDAEQLIVQALQGKGFTKRGGIGKATVEKLKSLSGKAIEEQGNNIKIAFKQASDSFAKDGVKLLEADKALLKISETADILFSNFGKEGTVKFSFGTIAVIARELFEQGKLTLEGLRKLAAGELEGIDINSIAKTLKPQGKATGKQKLDQLKSAMTQALSSEATTQLSASFKGETDTVSAEKAAAAQEKISKGVKETAKATESVTTATKGEVQALIEEKGILEEKIKLFKNMKDITKVLPDDIIIELSALSDTLKVIRELPESMKEHANSIAGAISNMTKLKEETKKAKQEQEGIESATTGFGPESFASLETIKSDKGLSDQLRKILSLTPNVQDALRQLREEETKYTEAAQRQKAIDQEGAELLSQKAERTKLLGNALQELIQSSQLSGDEISADQQRIRDEFIKTFSVILGRTEFGSPAKGLFAGPSTNIGTPGPLSSEIIDPAKIDQAKAGFQRLEEIRAQIDQERIKIVQAFAKIFAEIEPNAGPKAKEAGAAVTRLLSDVVSRVASEGSAVGDIGQRVQKIIGAAISRDFDADPMAKEISAKLQEALEKNGLKGVQGELFQPDPEKVLGKFATTADLSGLEKEKQLRKDQLNLISQESPELAKRLQIDKDGINVVAKGNDEMRKKLAAVARILRTSRELGSVEKEQTIENARLVELYKDRVGVSREYLGLEQSIKQELKDGKITIEEANRARAELIRGEIVGTKQGTALKEAVGSIDSLRKGVKKTGIEMGEFSRQTIRSGSHITDFNEQMVIATQKIIRYRVAFTAMHNAYQLFIDGFKTSKQIELGLARIAKVTDITRDSFKGLKDDIFDLASTFGAEIGDTLDTLKTFAQAGFTLAESMNLSRAALLGVNGANLTLEESTNLLLSAVKTYKFEMFELEGAIDKVVKIQAQHAVTAQDLAASIKLVGASAANVGLEMDQFLGIVTAIAAVTRKSGREIGNSLKTMFARFTRPEPLAKMQSTLSDFNFTVLDSSGSLRNMMDILGDINSAWDTLTNVQRINIATAVGGTRRYADFVVLMDNFQEAVDATADSLNSQGVAQRANLLEINTLDGATRVLKNTTLEFIDALFNSAPPGAPTVFEFVNRLAKSGKGIVGFLKDISLGLQVLFTGFVVQSLGKFVKIAGQWGERALIIERDVKKLSASLRFPEAEAGAPGLQGALAARTKIIKSFSRAQQKEILGIIRAYRIEGGSIDVVNAKLASLGITKEQVTLLAERQTGSWWRQIGILNPLIVRYEALRASLIKNAVTYTALTREQAKNISMSTLLGIKLKTLGIRLKQVNIISLLTGKTLIKYTWASLKAAAASGALAASINTVISIISKFAIPLVIMTVLFKVFERFGPKVEETSVHMTSLQTETAATVKTLDGLIGIQKRNILSTKLLFNEYDNLIEVKKLLVNESKEEEKIDSRIESIKQRLAKILKTANKEYRNYTGAITEGNLVQKERIRLLLEEEAVLENLERRRAVAAKRQIDLIVQERDTAVTLLEKYEELRQGSGRSFRNAIEGFGDVKKQLDAFSKIFVTEFEDLPEDLRNSDITPEMQKFAQEVFGSMIPGYGKAADPAFVDAFQRNLRSIFKKGGTKDGEKFWEEFFESIKNSGVEGIEIVDVAGFKDDIKKLSESLKLEIDTGKLTETQAILEFSLKTLDNIGLRLSNTFGNLETKAVSANAKIVDAFTKGNPVLKEMIALTETQKNKIKNSIINPMQQVLERVKSVNKELADFQFGFIKVGESFDVAKKNMEFTKKAIEDLIRLKGKINVFTDIEDQAKSIRKLIRQLGLEGEDFISPSGTTFTQALSVIEEADRQLQEKINELNRTQIRTTREKLETEISNLKIVIESAKAELTTFASDASSIDFITSIVKRVDNEEVKKALNDQLAIYKEAADALRDTNISEEERKKHLVEIRLANEVLTKELNKHIGVLLPILKAQSNIVEELLRQEDMADKILEIDKKRAEVLKSLVDDTAGLSVGLSDFLSIEALEAGFIQDMKEQIKKVIREFDELQPGGNRAIDITGLVNVKGIEDAVNAIHQLLGSGDLKSGRAEVLAYELEILLKILEQFKIKKQIEILQIRYNRQLERTEQLSDSISSVLDKEFELRKKVVSAAGSNVNEELELELRQKKQQLKLLEFQKGLQQEIVDAASDVLIKTTEQKKAFQDAKNTLSTLTKEELELRQGIEKTTNEIQWAREFEKALLVLEKLNGLAEDVSSSLVDGFLGIPQTISTSLDKGREIRDRIVQQEEEIVELQHRLATDVEAGTEEWQRTTRQIREAKDELKDLKDELKRTTGFFGIAGEIAKNISSSINQAFTDARADILKDLIKDSLRKAFGTKDLSERIDDSIISGADYFIKNLNRSFIFGASLFNRSLGGQFENIEKIVKDSLDTGNARFASKAEEIKAIGNLDPGSFIDDRFKETLTSLSQVTKDIDSYVDRIPKKIEIDLTKVKKLGIEDIVPFSGATRNVSGKNIGPSLYTIKKSILENISLPSIKSIELPKNTSTKFTEDVRKDISLAFKSVPNTIGEYTKTEFIDKMAKSAEKFGLEISDVLALIAKESSFISNIKADSSSAAGLFQITAGTARGLDPETFKGLKNSEVQEKLSGLTVSKQIDLFEKLMSNHVSLIGRTFNNIEEAYLAWFLGIGKFKKLSLHKGFTDDTVLFDSNQEGFKANKSLDKNGDLELTVGELLSSLRKFKKEFVSDITTLPTQPTVTGTILPAFDKKLDSFSLATDKYEFVSKQWNQYLIDAAKNDKQVRIEELKSINKAAKTAAIIGLAGEVMVKTFGNLLPSPGGAAFGGDIGTTFGNLGSLIIPGLSKTLIASLPVIGGLAGTLLGGIFGGKPDKEKFDPEIFYNTQALNENTREIRENTRNLLDLRSQLIGAPANFRLPAFATLGGAPVINFNIPQGAFITPESIQPLADSVSVGVSEAMDKAYETQQIQFGAQRRLRG
jgi:TP901 family phage tail tape measure protein